MASKVTLRNLNTVSAKDPNLGQALQDVINHLSTQLAQLQQAQTDIAALKAKVGL